MIFGFNYKSEEDVAALNTVLEELSKEDRSAIIQSITSILLPSTFSEKLVGLALACREYFEATGTLPAELKSETWHLPD